MITPIPCILLAATGAVAQPTWTHFASTPSRVSASSNPAPSIAVAAWTASTDIDGQPVAFAGPTGVVADEARAYAIGKSAGQTYLYAFDRATGATLWQAPIDATTLNSWSSPAIDTSNAAVLAPTGDTLHAIDVQTGQVLWTTTLPGPVVNASPLVTSDLPANRAFITTFDGFGESGALVCVNVDSFDAQLNPYEPGDIVWTATIGASTGNTPAYADAIVYVATAETPGRILAFDAGADATPSPIWVFDNPAGHAFFAGVASADDALFAASYSFSGGQLNSNLVKLDRATGTLAWSAPSGRTASTPIPIDDGRVVLSTGLPGFGSAPSIELFEDEGDHATILWDSALATWVDTDNDASLDPGEYLSIGGWTHEPIVADATGNPVLVVGSMADDGASFDPYAELRLIDLSAAPTDPTFILDHTTAAGSTPALTGTTLYSIGTNGLTAFASCPADCNHDGALNILDFVCFQQQFTSGNDPADCNTDGQLNILDFVCYQQVFVMGCTP